MVGLRLVCSPYFSQNGQLGVQRQFEGTRISTRLPTETSKTGLLLTQIYAHMTRFAPRVLSPSTPLKLEAIQPIYFFTSPSLTLVRA